MPSASQTQSFGGIRIDGQGNGLSISQVIHFAVSEIKMRPFVPSSLYMGQRRFGERNKDFFYGREPLIRKLLQLVGERNLVLVAGASGSGKSSVVRAGALAAGCSPAAKGPLLIAVMTPDLDPLSSLRALRKIGSHFFSVTASDS